MTTIEKIKAEIERRIYEISHPLKDGYEVQSIGKIEGLSELLDFLDTLESEKPMEQERLNEEIDKEIDELWAIKRDNSGQISNGMSEWKGKDQLMNIPAIRHFARHFYEIGCRRTAEKYDEIEYNRQRAEESVPKDLEEAAKKYAEESCFDDPEFTATMLAYKAGAKGQKEQMMKEAVEYEVGMHGEPIKITFDKYVQRARGIFPGDKVRIIIVKED